uniref:Calpain_III domain-containing protein n=1 Tax=Macrostomum lignano TaxID=282301 RepID=A0A1I8F5X3_9PLAT
LKFEAGGQSTPHFFCCYVSERAELGFLQLTDFCCLGWGDKIAAAAGNQSKNFLTVVKNSKAVRILVTMPHFLLADLAQFQPPPQPDTVEGEGFIARLGGAKALPKFRAKGYEYEVSFTALTDIRATFEKVIATPLRRPECRRLRRI